MYGVVLGFCSEFVSGIQELASTTIDVRAGIKKFFMGGSVASHVANAYSRILYGDALLSSLPDVPEFVINATNVQSGVIWRFSKMVTGDWRVGEVRNLDLRLSQAVAASSAFPPFLSPLILNLKGHDF
jgi:NTE family protein